MRGSAKFDYLRQYLVALAVMAAPIAAPIAAFLATTPAFCADADNGLRLAQRWCQACHMVSPGQGGTTSDQAPPFATIAKTPGFDAGKIAFFLLDPHPKMPDMGLSRIEAGDLAAYIATLK